MEDEEMLEQTNETENVDTQTTEEFGEGIELTDTSDATEAEQTNNVEVEEETKEVKTFTQKEVDVIVQKRLARKERDYQKELSKYKSAEEVLKTGLGATDINDAEDKLREFWTNEGIVLPERVKPGLTEHQLEILAKDEAREIIDSGDAETEANRLATKGWENMNTQEKAVFNTLVEHLNHEKKINELKSIGVKADLLDSKEFKNFASKFNSDTSIKDIYELYSRTHKEEKKIEKMGSMTTQKPDKEKDYYTKEEVDSMTEEEVRANFDVIKRSTESW